MAVLAARAKEQAENMESLARNLRHALEMRDEVVALAEAGDLYRGEASLFAW